MIQVRRKFTLVPNLMLALLLLAAQTSSFAHAYEHEVGNAQSQACAACVTAGQLACDCVDKTRLRQNLQHSDRRLLNNEYISESIDALVIRQRGPPFIL